MQQKTIALAHQFEQFFTLNFPVVKKFASLLLKSEQDAEDIAQEVFARLWAQPGLWQEKTETGGFLYTVTRNLTLDFIRHRNIEHTYQEQLEPELLGFNDPLDSMYYEELQLMLRLLLEQMPERRRQIFEMSRFRKMSNNEIAETLHISVRTVEHQIYLALSELRKTLVLSFLFILLK